MCEHRNLDSVWATNKRCWLGFCPDCGATGEYAFSRAQAAFKFKHKQQEKIMSTEDYKRGVEDATKPVTLEEIHQNPLVGINYFSDVVLAERRKKLLTKKVIKWTGVIKSNYSHKPYLLDLYDSKEDIEHYYTISTALCPPIKLEIEVPL